MKKFLPLLLAALIFFPAAAVQAADISDFNEIDAQNIKCYRITRRDCFLGLSYECKNSKSREYAARYVSQLTARSNFKLSRHEYDPQSEAETWWLVYTGAQAKNMRTFDEAHVWIVVIGSEVEMVLGEGINCKLFLGGFEP